MTWDARCSVRVGAGMLAIFLLAGCTPHPRPVPVVMPSPTTAPWNVRNVRGLEIRTDHWTIYTTTTAPYWMEALPVFAEACYAQYQMLVPAPEAARSLTLYVFANAVQWEDFALQRGLSKASIDVQSQLRGFAHKDVSAVYVNSPADTLRAIAHTGMHQYLWQHTPAEVPTWISEGLAVLAEGFDQRDRGRFVFEPRFNYQRYQQARVAIQRKWLMDLHTMLTTDDLKRLPNPDSAPGTYLAQLWSIMTFLQNSREYRKGFEQMRLDLADDTFQLKLQGYMAAGENGLTPGEAAFRLYITEDKDRFWREYYDKTIRYLNLAR